MKIKLVSDLHLEFSDIVINNDQNCDVLILAGDILTAEVLHDHKPDSTGLTLSKKANNYRNFLRNCSEAFPHVIYVAGNHEFYGGKWVSSLNDLRDECAAYTNMHFLENDTKVIDDITFVGGTLWTNLNKQDPHTMFKITSDMNDYKVIKNDSKSYGKLKPIDTVKRHFQTLEYFANSLEADTAKTYVVVSHHAPTPLSVHERYRGDTVTNSAYYSDLSDFILDHPQIKLWVHGHTHDPFDYMMGDTRVVCNPRGYGFMEDTGWDINKVIEIG